MFALLVYQQFHRIELKKYMKSFANTFLYIRLIIDLNYNTKTKLCHNNKKNYNNKSPKEAAAIDQKTFY